MENEQERSLREKLNTMFSRYNYVGVRNILSVPFEWSVALEQNELLGMGNADGLNEEEMARNRSGKFLPTDAVTRGVQKIVKYKLEPGERKMLLGEAAYTIIDKIFYLYVKENHVPKIEPGSLPNPQQLALTKAGLAKIRNPQYQDQVIPKILVGPIVKNVDQALQTYVNAQIDKIEDGFTDVQTTQSQTEEPKSRGFSDPEVLRKAQETRRANKEAAAAS